MADKEDMKKELELMGREFTIKKLKYRLIELDDEKLLTAEAIEKQEAELEEMRGA